MQPFGKEMEDNIVAGYVGWTLNAEGGETWSTLSVMTEVLLAVLELCVLLYF
jgi:hypothetical protein